MANDKNTQGDSNIQMLHAGEQMREQTRGTIDSYFGVLRQSIASMPSGGTELGEQIKSYATKNVATTHEFLNKLSRAKDFEQLMRLQSAFMQAQVQDFAPHSRQNRASVSSGINVA
jgi:hypothetical protein